MSLSKYAKLGVSVLLAAYAALLVVTSFKPPAAHYDFDLRMNEIQCLRQGVNPFDIWNGSVTLKPYYPNMQAEPPPEGFTEPVNAYAPWEYVFMLPLSYLPREVAWGVYCLILLAMTAVLVAVPFRRMGWCAALPLLVCSYPIWSNHAVGNFAVIVLAAAAMMAVCLNAGRDVLAGVCWAVVMIKPQIGLIFAIPLLMRGKIVVCAVASAICLVASCVAAWMCDGNLFSMLLQGPAANTVCFRGCGTYPYFLCGLLPVEIEIVIAALVGVVACAWMTWRSRGEKDWMAFLMPAAIISSCWTYTQAYSHAMGWFVVLVLVGTLRRQPRNYWLWAVAVLSLPVLSRVLLAAHGLAAFAGWALPISEYAFRGVDSLNSSLALVIAVVLVRELGRVAKGVSG